MQVIFCEIIKFYEIIILLQTQYLRLYYTFHCKIIYSIYYVMILQVII